MQHRFISLIIKSIALRLNAYHLGLIIAKVKLLLIG